MPPPRCTSREPVRDSSGLSDPAEECRSARPASDIRPSTGEGGDSKEKNHSIKQ